MKNNHRYTTLALLVLFTVTANSQSKTRTVSGIVKSFEESFPLEGVSINVKGSKTSSGTQPDGIYYINVSDKDSILVFSLAGYETQEIKISTDNEYNVVLKAGNNISQTYYLSQSSQLRCWRRE